MPSPVALILALTAFVVGCGGSDDETIQPDEERSVRAYFATVGATHRESSCIIDELIKRVGVEPVAELSQLTEIDSEAERETSREFGEDFALSFVACDANPIRTDCFSLWDTKAEAEIAASHVRRARPPTKSVGAFCRSSGAWEAGRVTPTAMGAWRSHSSTEGRFV